MNRIRTQSITIDAGDDIVIRYEPTDTPGVWTTSVNHRETFLVLPGIDITPGEILNAVALAVYPGAYEGLGGPAMPEAADEPVETQEPAGSLDAAYCSRCDVKHENVKPGGQWTSVCPFADDQRPHRWVVDVEPAA